MEKFRLSIFFVGICSVSYFFKEKINSIFENYLQNYFYLLFVLIVIIFLGMFIIYIKMKNPKIIQKIRIFPQLVEYFFSVKALKDMVIIANIFLGLSILKKINHFEFINALNYTTLTFISICMGAILIKSFCEEFDNEERIELISTTIFFILNVYLQCYIQYNQCSIVFLFHLIINSINNGNNLIIVFKSIIIMLFLILLCIDCKEQIKKKLK